MLHNMQVFPGTPDMHLLDWPAVLPQAWEMLSHLLLGWRQQVASVSCLLGKMDHQHGTDAVLADLNLEREVHNLSLVL